MLNERIEYLLTNLVLDTKTVAEHASITPAGFSRLRSGSRSYKRSSPTVKRFISGVYLCMLESGDMDKLCQLIGSHSTQEEDIKNDLSDWLFSKDRVNLRRKVSPEVFSEKLRRVMSVAGVSNSRLAKDVNIDSSYISRMRNGKIPQRRSRLIFRLCESLSIRIIADQKQSDLAALIEIPSEYVTETETAELIFNWLYDNKMPESVQAIKTLIDNIDAFPALKRGPLPDIETIINDEILSDETGCYDGEEGLKKAVIRFLGTAYRYGSKELRLYSDQGMDWMSGDFNVKWAALMTACIKNGTSIKIIHHLERSANELINAINSWLPLYMSGLIEPYYNTKKSGERFSHTLFLDPERASIESFCVKGDEKYADFQYITDSALLAKRAIAYDKMISTSRPLVRMSMSSFIPNEKFSLHYYGSLQIFIGDLSVIVTKITDPTVSFTFTHPIMRKAFSDFVKTTGNRRTIR